ncbi:MAG: HAMP domain-containing histidine kinase [Planctomycetes bacterium]|nr:HAMP domain-containing histidine kinase [Planctomycetota bacterium]
MELTWSRSLAGRILLLAALNLVLLAAVLAVAADVRVPRSMESLMLQTTGKRIVDLARRLILELEAAPDEDADAVLARYSAEHRVAFLMVDNSGRRVAGAALGVPGDVVARVMAPPAPGSQPPGRPTPPRGASHGGRERVPMSPPFLVVSSGTPRYWLGVRIPIRRPSTAQPRPGTLLVASASFFSNPLLFEPGRWLGWALVALGLTILCWFPFLRNLTKTISRMEQATVGIAGGRFDTALAIRRRDELGRLATSIEQMAGRLGALLEGQKRFLGDTAHELRSPLGRMQVALEILGRRVTKGDRYLEDLREDVAEMGRLTDDLLEFARLEAGARTLAVKPVAVAEIVRRACRLESSDGVAIHVEVADDLEVMADADALTRAIANVLRNATCYSGDAGPIRVTACRHGPTVVISVSDCGPGVPADALPRLFDPFFRVHPARDRRSGGVGLGLAIVRSAVEACGGSATCQLVKPHGLEVRLSLPAPIGG